MISDFHLKHWLVCIQTLLITSSTHTWRNKTTNSRTWDSPKWKLFLTKGQAGPAPSEHLWKAIGIRCQIRWYPAWDYYMAKQDPRPGHFSLTRCRLLMVLQQLRVQVFNRSCIQWLLCTVWQVLGVPVERVCLMLCTLMSTERQQQL